MKLLRTLSGHRRPLAQYVGQRWFAAGAASNEAEYLKRNYASNEAEYNTVISSLTSQRRHYLLRDVYEDMLLDRVKPARDTFHSLIAGSMKGARLQDAFFFREEMKAMGLVPDVALYNFLISVSGKCKNSQQAIRVFEEMKRYEVKPTGQTFICLLNACAADGRLDRVYAIVGDMTAAGLGLNKFCYAGLIAAHRNKTPATDDTAAKIVELVEQSKGWSSVEASKDIAENVMMGICEEELYNIPTVGVMNRRGFVNRQLTVYHAAFHACADLKNVEAMETLLDMLKKENNSPDMFIQLQVMRCYLHSGDLDAGQRVYEEYINSGKAPSMELFTVTLKSHPDPLRNYYMLSLVEIFAEGAMVGYTSKGMELALSALETMMSRDFFLVPKTANDLLLIAAGEKTGGYTVANYIWDLMQSRKIAPTFAAVEAYYRGLKERDIPEDDQRLMLVTRTFEDFTRRFGPGFAPPPQDSRPAPPQSRN